MTTTGEPTLYELARTLERMDTELNRRLAEVAQTISQMVTRDLYEAHRAGLVEDIAQLREELKAERDKKTADRRMVVGALLAAGLSLIVTIVGAALVIAFKLNP
ncbi:hypothetical protein IMZ11_33640 [Microtetraspora sp. AC03309]|uniref:hypothetical protein n=1 Tax=Microtetraspora sp. AC03309 TaxID=2779376 RepID=UPI001E5542F4|nr:hypothetical protein [Microtetraspora sp. AC03309]MCC5580572.1 hypothetical protein [Microtetraspora sp. AC03309]